MIGWLEDKQRQKLVAELGRDDLAEGEIQKILIENYPNSLNDLTIFSRRNLQLALDLLHTQGKEVQYQTITDSLDGNYWLHYQLIKRLKWGQLSSIASHEKMLSQKMNPTVKALYSYVIIPNRVRCFQITRSRLRSWNVQIFEQEIRSPTSYLHYLVSDIQQFLIRPYLKKKA